MFDNQCIFCKILQRTAHAEILYRDELVTAFEDIHPVAPVHVLVIPNRHIESLNSATGEDEPVLGHMITIARDLAKEKQVEESGYRLVINTGPDAGQSVFHVHLHMIGGQYLPFRFH